MSLENNKELVPQVHDMEEIDDKIAFGKSPGWLNQTTTVQFSIDNIQFHCPKQAILFKKAVYFNDLDTAAKILRGKIKSFKYLNHKIRHVNKDLWKQVELDFIVQVNYAKFSQNPLFKQALLDTMNKVLVKMVIIKGEKTYLDNDLTAQALMQVRDKLKLQNPTLPTTTSFELELKTLGYELLLYLEKDECCKEGKDKYTVYSQACDCGCSDYHDSDSDEEEQEDASSVDKEDVKSLNTCVHDEKLDQKQEFLSWYKWIQCESCLQGLLCGSHYSNLRVFNLETNELDMFYQHHYYPLEGQKPMTVKELKTILEKVEDENSLVLLSEGELSYFWV